MLDKIRENPDTKYIVVSFLEPNPPFWMLKQIISNDGRRVGWEIPFMETKIDFINEQHDIKQAANYGDITFSLIHTTQDVFIYEISR